MALEYIDFKCCVERLTVHCLVAFVDLVYMLFVCLSLYVTHCCDGLASYIHSPNGNFILSLCVNVPFMTLFHIP